ncbi:MAG: tetratricopeptide repeat protein [Xanthobacteraceae bacterium]|nr:tetratricopeptide repeat protein [Xanthobacteraceae bacterium]
MVPAAGELLQEGLRLHRAGALKEATELYAQALAVDSGNLDARYYLCLVVSQQGRTQEALSRASEFLAADVRQPRVHKLVGSLLARMGRSQEALNALDSAISLAPDQADIHGTRGDVLMDLGRLSEAVASYDLALARQPDSFHDWLSRGIALVGLGRDHDATESYGKALALQPASPVAHFNRANVQAKRGHHEAAIADYNRTLELLSQAPGARFSGVSLADIHAGLAHALGIGGRTEEALGHYEMALKGGPLNAQTHFNHGNALVAVGRHSEAVPCYERALEQDPNFTKARLNLASACIDIRQFDRTVAECRRVLAAEPDNGMAHLNLAWGLLELGRPEEALPHCRTALSARPELASTHRACGNALQRLGQHDEAVEHFNQALRLAPRDAEAHCDLGCSYEALGRVDEALQAYDRLQSINSDHAQGQFNKGVLLLSRARFEGYPFLEKRFDLAGAQPLSEAAPRWDGRAVDGKLLVWAEQGLGDHIIYGGLLEELTRMATTVVVEVEPRLVSLFARSFSGLQIAPAGTGATAGPIAAQVPIASLPGYLRPNLSAFPKRDRGYLVAEPSRSRALRDRLAVGRGHVVGLSWVSRNPLIGRLKTARLQDLEPVLRLPDCRFIDLQYGDTLADRQAIEREFGIHIERVADIDNTNDLEGLAGLMTACDAVVTVSNTTTHLAGALGVRTWVMAPNQTRLWYWFKGIADSPWYPFVRVHDQKPAQAWTDVATAVADEVRGFLAKRHVA